MTRQFFRKADAAVVVYDVTNETSFLTSNATTLEGREAAIDVFDEADGRSRKVEGNLVGII